MVLLQMMIARLIKSFTIECLEYQPALFLEHSSWCPNSSTSFLQTQLWATHCGIPRGSDTAMRNYWFSRKVPYDDNGNVSSTIHLTLWYYSSFRLVGCIFFGQTLLKIRTKFGVLFMLSAECLIEKLKTIFPMPLLCGFVQC